MSPRPGKKHHRETEIKLPVRDSQALRRRLRRLGFRRVQARHFERNYLFDFPDQRLRKARCLLRLRFAGRQGILTFKGVPPHSGVYKTRREIETPVGDGPVLREMLEELGLREGFRYEKYRTIYAPHGQRKGAEGPHLFYDETPIGDYLELEGSEQWIDKVAQELGYSRKEYITCGYPSLYFQKCLEVGSKPGNMIFPARPDPSIKRGTPPRAGPDPDGSGAPS
jgi:adenylate cyclase class 2